MKREDFAGNLRNYNGTGIWAIGTVQQRYREYCAISGVEPSRSLTPREHSDSNTRSVYPIMDEVIRGIEDADPACIALGVDFVHEDALFPLGARLKG